MEKVLYLSGPISNMPNLNRDNFEVATKMLRSKGFIVINPHEICDGIPASEWDKCMRVCIKRMMDADLLVMLEGWEYSKGANLERAIAYEINIEKVEFVQFINGLN